MEFILGVITGAILTVLILKYAHMRKIKRELEEDIRYVYDK